MGLDDLPVAVCVELQCEKEIGFQFARRAPITSLADKCLLVSRLLVCFVGIGF
jgi:hypothetical protein